jgi:hypothetical protein
VFVPVVRLKMSMALIASSALRLRGVLIDIGVFQLAGNVLLMTAERDEGL